MTRNQAKRAAENRGTALKVSENTNHPGDETMFLFRSENISPLCELTITYGEPDFVKVPTMERMFYQFGWLETLS